MKAVNENKLAFRSTLLQWYTANRRRMPWRGDDTSVVKTAYSVWVSEVMLQQTRVETVVSYWNLWMITYPTVADLASASEDEVNKLWAGLGYYRRAQNLRLGAKHIVEKHDGTFPFTKDEVLAIPGIGPYTAGAILSIAFGQQEPLVDGNVLRVFSRLFALRSEQGGGKLEKESWHIAEQLVDPTHPADFNQGIMELGATVCSPTNPGCDRCPVQTFCKAYALINKQPASSAPKDYTLMQDITEVDLEDVPASITAFPFKKEKKKAKEVSLLVAVLRDTNQRILMRKRPEKGLLANQWEFPGIILPTQEATEDEEEQLQRQHSTEHWPLLLSHLQEHCQVTLAVDEHSISWLAEPIIHIFSHERHTMRVAVINTTERPSLSTAPPTLAVIDLVDEENSGVALQPSQVSLSASSSGVQRLQWRTVEEIIADGITTGCKKILKAVESMDYSSNSKKSISGNKRRIKDPDNNDKEVVENAFELMLLSSKKKTKSEPKAMSKAKHKRR